jgi:hypothetical protein
MQSIVDFFKNIPEDVRQAVYSLSVSALLIAGSLLILGNYLDSIKNPPDSAVSATLPEETEENPEGDLE